MGRAFDDAPDRLLAYISNIGGSLAGIAAFALASYFGTRPVVWFAIVLLLWWYFLKRRTVIQGICLVAILVLVGFVSYYVSISAPLQTKSSTHSDMVAVLQDYCTRRGPASSRPTTSATRRWCRLPTLARL